jgi:hypothetical protein
MATTKTHVIERIFLGRWQAEAQPLSQSLVTIEDIAAAIRTHNEQHPNDTLSDRNPANFFKDFIRNRKSANANWPERVLAAGFTARQITGNNRAFEFVPLLGGQVEPFPETFVPTADTPRREIETVSLPVASRRLGRSDESWLVQVLVRLRIIETHFSLYSPRRIVQLDHLQMSVKLRGSEIDALFLATEEVDGPRYDEIIVCCEAKGRRDDILEDQILRQVQAVFGIPGVTQDRAIAIAVKAIGPSEVFCVEFDVISRAEAPEIVSLTPVSQTLYVLRPPIPGIGA